MVLFKQLKQVWQFSWIEHGTQSLSKQVRALPDFAFCRFGCLSSALLCGLDVDGALAGAEEWLTLVGNGAAGIAGVLVVTLSVVFKLSLLQSAGVLMDNPSKETLPIVNPLK